MENQDTQKRQKIRADDYDAALFDLDGVVVRTAETHAAAWKKTFDEYLEKRNFSDSFVPFDLKRDYTAFVDGKPRIKGVRDFLLSRGIDLPPGAKDDTPGRETLNGIGNRKNVLFSQLLEADGVRVYESTTALIEQLRKNGFKTAIVSSSKNCVRILETANIHFLFDVLVDGVVSEKQGLSGKPEPDIFLEAARKLGADVRRCIIFEDALSGVSAGEKGGVGLVVGVNRADQASLLKESGAHLVVDDLSEIDMEIMINKLPRAVQHVDEIIELTEASEPMIILDWECISGSLEADGAAASSLKEALSALSELCSVTVVCPDQTDPVKAAIGLDTVHCICGRGNISVHGIADSLNLSSRIVYPVYIGKAPGLLHGLDFTGKDGLFIAAGTGTTSTAAAYGLISSDQISRFLLRFCRCLERGTGWDQVFMGFDPDDEGRRETLCAMGNGYFVTRGAAPEASMDGVHYPGTYLAGGYNRLKTEIQGTVVENEDLVNIPNWLSLRIRVLEDNWYHLKDVDILFYRQTLNMKKGLLSRVIRIRDRKGRETLISHQSFVHGEQMHLGGLRMRMTPLNWAGTIEICSALNSRVINQGVDRYKDLRSRHLDLVSTRQVDEKCLSLKVRTNGSGIDIAMGVRTEVYFENKTDEVYAVPSDNEKGHIAKRFTAAVNRGDSLVIEKLVSIYTSRDSGTYECLSEAENAVADSLTDFSGLLASHLTAWQMLWGEFDFILELDDRDLEQHTQKILRLYIFHLLQSSSVHSLDIDVGMPARGWHGEGYRGHIFWDEMVIFPFLNFRAPRITRTLLMYRYRRLNEARKAARRAGYEGAMYPWQSGSNGREETQKMHLNPVSGRWIPDNTHLQRHVNNAIVYNIWQYFQITNDIQFLSFYGGEIIIEIARFWASAATYDSGSDRYELYNVMGPDEYHDAYPGKSSPGLNNNAYTNLMVVFVMIHALSLQHVLPRKDWASLRQKLLIKDRELSKWKKMSRRMKLVFHRDGILSQFEGYENLKEFDWSSCRRRYGNIRRLDRILEKEGDSPNHYKLSKQPDVLMLFYLFSSETLKKMFKRLDYIFDKDFIGKNINYYLKRTTNGSSLALVIHAWIEARQARKRSWSFFSRALETDMFEDHEGSIREGIHLAAMSGCIDILQRAYAGLEVRSDILILNPQLSKSINRIRFHIRYRKHWLDIEITQKAVTVKSLTNRAIPFTMMVKDEMIKLYPGGKAMVDI